MAAPTESFVHAQPEIHSRAWLYILVADGHEDMRKVGMTRDPLARWSAFHPRWYEIFDLEHSLLVGCESRRDAQALETALHRALAGQRCPMPLNIRTSAAGTTEWYRGAYALTTRFAEHCAERGHPVHWDARPVLAASLRAQADCLHGLLREGHQRLLDGWLHPAQCRALVDLVDGYCRFDAALASRLPERAWQDLRRANVLRRGK